MRFPIVPMIAAIGEALRSLPMGSGKRPQCEALSDLLGQIPASPLGFVVGTAVDVGHLPLPGDQGRVIFRAPNSRRTNALAARCDLLPVSVTMSRKILGECVRVSLDDNTSMAMDKNATSATTVSLRDRGCSTVSAGE